MASELKMCMVVVSVLMLVSSFQSGARGGPQVPCYFIFGDSLADDGNNNDLVTQAKANYQPYGIDFPIGTTGRFCNGRTTVDIIDSLADDGNNNLLPTIAKANYPPYGIDFPSGSTGRFCNGRTTFNIIAELLGFDNYIPPFATAKGDEIIKGVNYASGAAGIRSESGQQQGARISMDGQLQNHQNTVWRITQILRNNASAANDLLNKCIYTVGIGNNDYVNNYFMPEIYPTSRQYTPEQYAFVLIEQYSQQLQTLYKNGARKVAAIGLGQIGCTPYEMARYGTGGLSCVDEISNAVQLFNARLKLLVTDLNNKLTDAKFTYLDSYRVAASLPSLGFTVLNAPCCEVGIANFTCRPYSNPCANRAQYVFWDNVHSTEALNALTAQKYYNSPLPSDAEPYNIRELALL